MKSFSHLHTHTEYSLLDGAAKQREALRHVHEMGQPALAMTDHANVFGAYDFVRAANAEGVKPIVGMEANVAPRSRFDKEKLPFRGVGEKENYGHMTLWAENNVGMQNLFRLSTLGSTEGFYSKARIDKELLSKYGEGIIGTTGCFGGEVNRLLDQGFYDEALAAASDYKDILGAGNFYAEIMDHGLTEERGIFPQLLKIAKTLDLPLVATNDAHYTHDHQAESHDALLCINTGAHINDEKRFRFNGEGYYLKSAEEMRTLWKDFPEACDNTLVIAERCNVTFVPRDDLMPQFPVPEGYTEETYLDEQVWQGARRRYGEITPEIEDRLKYELSVINSKRYPGYFLVVSDFIAYGKSKGIMFGPGRGSAGGSCVAYVLGITELDPIELGLMFERFLNPDRPSPPDIDIDIQEDRRGEVIEYVIDKYGSEKVCQIITFSTLKGKSGIKDAARVLGKSVSFGQKLSNLYPPAHLGKDAPMESIYNPKHNLYKESASIREEYEANPEAKEVIDLAYKWEGLKRGTGVHAAGVMMASQPLLDVIPLIRNPKDKDGILTQFEYPACEDLGLLKMDFLGLKNLTVIVRALEHIKRNHGIEIDVNSIPQDDPKTFHLFSQGHTLGVFQLDGGPMRSLLRLMRPTHIEDIVAVLALYRPGPMGANAHISYANRKNGKEKITYIHPELEEALKPILENTYGVIVYQEQVMKIAQTVAGYSLAAADLLRKAMGKKKKEVLEAEFIPFEKGMKDHGYSDVAIKTLWDILVPFSDYAFNRAHTAGYGLLSYWNGYLKANYPSEYMAALLSSADDKDTQSLYLSECRRMRIPVLPPDVNISGYGYTPNENGDILFGLGSLKGIGEGPVQSIEKGRQKGKYESLTDFFFRSGVPKRAVDPLIKSGALDSFGYSRAGMTQAYDPIYVSAKIRHDEHMLGIRDLFTLLNTDSDSEIDITDPVIPTEEWEDRELLDNEYDVIGTYLSGHPLDGYIESIRRSSSVEWSEIPDLPEGKDIIIGGLLSEVSHSVSKRGNPWASMNLVSMDSIVEMRCFDRKILEGKRELFESGKIVKLKATIDRSSDDESLTLIVRDIKPITVKDIDLPPLEPIVISVSQEQLGSTVNEQKEIAVALDSVLRNNRGNHKFIMELEGSKARKVFPHTVAETDSLKRKLLELFGVSCIKSGLGE